MAQLTVSRAMPVVLIGLLIWSGSGNAADPASSHLGLKTGYSFYAHPELNLAHMRLSDSASDAWSESSVNRSGIGDLTAGLAETLVRERGWRPDLIGRLNYSAGHGKAGDGTVFLGNGFRHLQAELVALKRQDPLAFIASIAYSKIVERDQVQPGAALGFSLTATLTASPSMSWQTGFTHIIRWDTESNGIGNPRSTYGMFNISASSLIAHNLMINTELGIGIGTPKYSLTISLPLAF